MPRVLDRITVTPLGVREYGMSFIVGALTPQHPWGQSIRLFKHALSSFNTRGDVDDCNVPGYRLEMRKLNAATRDIEGGHGMCMGSPYRMNFKKRPGYVARDGGR